MKISLDILNMDYNTRIEIMERALEIKKLLEEYYKTSPYNDTRTLITNTLRKYKEIYGRNIDSNVEACIVLGVIFSDTKTFMRRLRSRKYNLEKTAQIYGTTKNLVRIMYLNILDIHKKQNESLSIDETIKKALTN